MSEFELPQIDRRTTLAWLAAAASWSTLHGRALAIGHQRSVPTKFLHVAQGYGSDPDLVHPKVPWSRTLSREQLRQCAVLADLILPPTPGAPAPSAVGVADFIDEWVSAPYSTQVKDRPVILTGLAWLDEEARRRFHKSWVTSRENECTQLLNDIASPVAESEGQHRFFQRVRYLIVGAYYSTEAGWQDIGYIGNVALSAFPPVAPNVVAILEERLQRLGV